ncbi:hypothetical protein [Bythopirellula polymerisocia]|uniref:hypothetical protein n=1 Tax=Bythopirellula polymerisocia TaxID=2528003 RepID=UPI0011B6A22E|nr:hypothetical protein [Bythopirellula polymerisocia]
MAASDNQAAPLFERLYVQNQVLPGASALPGFNAVDTARDNGNRSLVTAPNGNFVVTVNTDPTQGNAGFVGTFYHFGSTDQGITPTALRRESTIAGQEQETFSSNGIDNAGNITYTATIKNPSAPPTRFGSLWENDTLIFRHGDAITTGPLAGNFFASASGAYRSPTGISNWISSYSDTSLGASTGSALFRSTTNFDVLLKSGDMIGTEGTIVSESGAILANIRWSDSGNNYITEVDLEAGFTATEDLLVINGQPATTPSGAVIRKGNAVSAIDGGLSGETWDLSGLYDINNTGDFIFSAFNDGVVNDSVLALNGAIIHRENEVVDGVSLSGQVQGVAINDIGDIAYVWNDTLFINDQVIAGLGTLVDTNADGVGDTPITNQALGQIEITNLPAAGGDLPVVYLGLDVGGLTSQIRLIPAFADFDDDDDIDGRDFLIWQRGYGTGTSRAEGDANWDGLVDESDLAIWQARYGQTAPGGTLSGVLVRVPEPTSLSIILVALVCLGIYRGQLHATLQI